MARRFAVQGIPTLVVMVKGQEKARQTGAAPEYALRSWLERSLAIPPLERAVASKAAAIIPGKRRTVFTVHWARNGRIT